MTREGFVSLFNRRDLSGWFATTRSYGTLWPGGPTIQELRPGMFPDDYNDRAADHPARTGRSWAARTSLPTVGDPDRHLQPSLAVTSRVSELTDAVTHKADLRPALAPGTPTSTTTLNSVHVRTAHYGPKPKQPVVRADQLRARQGRRPPKPARTPPARVLPSRGLGRRAEPGRA